MDLLLSNTTISCKVFEDKNGALERPRTKDIATKYHYFRDSVKSGAIEVLPIDTLEQLAVILTKGLDQKKFEHLRMKLIG